MYLSQFFIKYLRICLAMLLLCYLTVSAATYYVDDNGPNDPGPFDPNVSDTLENGGPNHPFDRIQEGINAAVNGDTVTVLSGYYQYAGNIHFNGKNITLTSTDPEDPNIIATTIIDGGQNGSVVTFSGSETSDCQLCGFTIRNGHALRGGGVCGGNDTNETQATIAGCVISGNTSHGEWSIGGGLADCGGSISNCIISGNTAEFMGGGLTRCDGRITNCIITGNSAGYGGGMDSCHGTIANCAITGNVAGSGSALYWCNGTIINCTIAGNTGSSWGGFAACNALISNCILWGNSGNQLSSSSNINYSCIQNWTGSGTGNISSDPNFADTSSGNPAEWNLHLLPGSPCIDAGTNSPPGGLSATDIEGFTRPFDGNADGNSIADMGAYEFSGCDEPYLFVTPLSFSFTALEAGANPNSQILRISNLGGGTVNWSADLTGKPDWLTVTPASGSLEMGESETLTLSVDISGLSGGEYSYSFWVSDPTVQNNTQTVIVELYVSEAFYIDVNNINDPLEDGSWDHPFDRIQEGIDATNGDPNFPLDTVTVLPGTYYENINFNGKQLVLTSTDPNDPNIVAATVIDGGGNDSAVRFSGDESILWGFTITNGRYGGIYGGGTKSMIRNCKIIGNSSTYHGAGLMWYSGLITNCIIAGNAAPFGGGLANCNGRITNCTIMGNTASNDGGGFYECEDAIITNCTIVGNTAGRYGGGLSYMSCTIRNCIIWDNRAMTEGNQVYLVSIPIFSCIEGWTAWQGSNISHNPMFKDIISNNPADWDLHLLPGSACIDAGTNTPPGGLPTTDKDGNLRPFDGDLDGTAVADMGAYEFHEFPHEPCLNALPRSFIFTAIEDANSPASQNLTISNCGYQTLDWFIDSSSTPGWLGVMPNSGLLDFGESEIIPISVDMTGLDSGFYQGSFGVIDLGNPNSQRTISVSLMITQESVAYVPLDFLTIQAAINASCHGDTIIVLPGTYYEYIKFNGKNIILTSVNPYSSDIVAATVIDGQRLDRVVAFDGRETSDCKLSGFTITRGKIVTDSRGVGISGHGTQATIANCIITNNIGYKTIGGGLYDCDGTIANCTISGNLAQSGGGLFACDGTITKCTILDNYANEQWYGDGGSGGGLLTCRGTISYCTIMGNTADDDGGGLCSCHGLITNCIIWGNIAGDLGDHLYNSSSPTYSCIQDWIYGGTGNISSNPLFVDETNSDYHLKSEYGRWDPNTSIWVYDHETSPCIDAGDPASDWTEELWPHGERTNMGAYGGTPQASMSPNPVGNIADLNHNDVVDLNDLALFCNDWLITENLLDTDLNRNGAVDIADFAVFTNQWLWGEP